MSALEGRRAAGILAHPTSVAAGTLGGDARRFVRWLAEAGFSVWQMLPVGVPARNGSPYDSISAFAGGVHLIDAADLVERGWLPERPKVLDGRALDAARARCLRAPEADRRFEAFRARNADWLEDFALYCTIAEAHGDHWWSWPAALREREPAALARHARERADALARIRFAQFVFDVQWRALHAYAREHGVRLFGDMPMFVARHAADVWARPELFLLDARGRPRVVAGVPPDAFSATGQRWGNPMYDWNALAAEDFLWWRQRLERQLDLFDLLRIDHFRALEACWHIPADAEDAREGHWEPTPGEALLASLAPAVREHLVAEDLGIITPAVEALRERFALPGMHVLQFAFDDADSTHLPRNHRRHAVVYTGTHDNDTTLGWWRARDPAQREHVLAALGRPSEPMPWPVIDAALASRAALAMLPMQDPLELGGAHRMNTPGTETGNWSWRFEWADVPPGLHRRLHARLARYERLPASR